MNIWLHIRVLCWLRAMWPANLHQWLWMCILYSKNARLFICTSVAAFSVSVLITNTKNVLCMPLNTQKPTTNDNARKNVTKVDGLHTYASLNDRSFWIAVTIFALCFDTRQVSVCRWWCIRQTVFYSCGRYHDIESVILFPFHRLRYHLKLSARALCLHNVYMCM